MNRKHLSIVLFLVALAIIVLVYVLDYRQSAVLMRSFHQVEESQESLIRINKISSYLKDIQRSHRGYVITHRREFLAPYQNASEALPTMIRNLANDLEGDSEQQKLIETLSRIASRKLEYVEEAIAQVNTKQYDKAINGIGMGKMLFDRMLLLTEQIESRERMLMESSRKDVQAQADLVFAIVISGLIVSLLLFLGALIIIYRSQSKIEKLNHKIDETNKELHDANEALIYANHQLENANDALQKVNSELNDFSYSISHDLKAPLRAIRGYCEMLKEDVHEGMDERTVKTINTIEQNARRMDHLINDLLHLARLGNSPLVKQPVDMKTIVAEVLTEQSLAPNIKVNLLPMDGAKADPGLVRQVWENLLSNAAKFSSKKESPEIEIGCKKDGTEQIYWVKDNGVGFDPAYSDKLFKVFSRLHAKKDFEGTGAGLAIVKRIVDAHGGRIWAEAEVSKGAAFYFTLPAN